MPSPDESVDFEVLAALVELGDGTKAWYVDRAALCRKVGLTDGKLTKRLRAMEQGELVEPTFTTPLRWRIRRAGEALLQAQQVMAKAYWQNVELERLTYQMTIQRFVDLGCVPSQFPWLALTTREGLVREALTRAGVSRGSIAQILDAGRDALAETETAMGVTG